MPPIQLNEGTILVPGTSGEDPVLYLGLGVGSTISLDERWTVQIDLTGTKDVRVALQVGDGIHSVCGALRL